MERFWNRLQTTPSGCRVWTGYCGPKGYGTVRLSNPRRTVLTHRAAWELTFGKVPRGLCVLHRCDNPPCCNPDHLWLGTLADNNEDMKAKMRNRYKPHHGEQHGRAKLTKRQVSTIRKLYASGNWSHPTLGAKFGVSHTQIGRIVRGQSWMA